jgi:hypothetical protein
VQAHPEQIPAQIAIVIEVTGSDPSGRSADRDMRRGEAEFRETSRELESDFAIKMDVEEPFDRARLVAALDRRCFFASARQSDGFEG